MIEHTLLCILGFLPSDIVVDMTYGEGGFWSENLKSYFPTENMVFCDMFKHKDAYPEPYQSTHPLEALLSHGEFRQNLKGVIKALIYDPPYAVIQGGHIITNCNWKTSMSRIFFNFRYGVDYTYTEAQILCMYAEGFKNASSILMVEGYFLVKTANFETFNLADQVENMALHFGFVEHLKSPIPVRDGASRLYIFQKPRQNTLARQTNVAAKTPSLLKICGFPSKTIMSEKITSEARKDYKNQIKSHLDEATGWSQIGREMLEQLSAERAAAAIVNVSDEFRQWHALLALDKTSDNIKEQYMQRSDIRVLQRAALDCCTLLTEAANITGLLWEQILLSRDIDIGSKDALGEKRKIAKAFIPQGCGETAEEKEKWAKKLNNDSSHVSLSSNIAYYNGWLKCKNRNVRLVELSWSAALQG